MKGIEAGASTMVEIFEKEACYRSPLFQRQYVWGKTQISELWDDITQIVEGVESSRFLGAVVFDIKSAGKAFNADDIQIIDGQQRLSTIYFLLYSLVCLPISMASMMLPKTCSRNMCLYRKLNSAANQRYSQPFLIYGS